MSNGSAKFRLLDWLDAIAKLVGAFAVVAVAVFANSLQTRVSGISIQSQREQAESQLRANMFTSLITPIVGTQTNGDSVPADRERLLAELLALNFYENFELKPLLQDASDRLLADAEARRKLPPDGSDVREPLWSIARRIAERQKASISWEWASYRENQKEFAAPGRTVTVARFRAIERAGMRSLFSDRSSPSRGVLRLSGRDRIVGYPLAFRETAEMNSPDGKYTLRLVVSAPDWKNQTVKLSAQPFVTGQEIKPTDPTYSFTLTWFDLPLTDNTLLPDGNRFAAYLRTFYPELETVRVAVMWFPNGYFTPRERPLNYSEVQELLGRKPQ